MNRVCLVGRLTDNPDKKATSTGLTYCRFRLAVNRPVQNAQGQRETDFINIVAWRKQAENVCLYLKKGSLVGIDGRIQTGSYTDSAGNKRYTTEVLADSVQFLESKTQSQNNSLSTNEPVTPSYQQQNVSPYDFYNQTQDYITDDPYADLGDTVTIDDDFLD